MITDVPGVLVGHHERVGDGWASGTTVVLVPDGAVGAVDQRGGAPGTRVSWGRLTTSAARSAGTA